ncbi:MAG TPA: HNH endonuclease, partial [Chlamydiae bacterium]|nr:HNH endonuclease [Chlamydiota bacterium]
PSLEHKLDSHLRIVKKIISFIPISKINVEVANFDIQKIKNPQIESSQYQRGDLYGYQNLKAYLVQREQAKCQLCSKKSTKGNSFRLHHIIPRKEGGTNKPNNLTLLHEKCHDKLHSKNLLHHIIPRQEGGTNKPNNLTLLHEKCHDKLHSKNLIHILKKNRQFKPETFMSSIRWKLVSELKKLCSDTALSFGYITKIKRNSLKLEKDHHTDAFVIANGSSEQRIQPFSFLQKRKNNRSLQLNRKGFKLSIRRQRYKVQPKDEVQVQSKKYEVIGVFNKGNWLRVRDKTKTFNFPIKKIEKHYYNNGWQFIPSLKERVFLPLKG